MVIKEIVKKSLSEVLEIIAAAGGGAITHWFITEIRDGKRVITGLDTDKIRAHSPYFVLKLSDEAEFNALVANLDSASQKNLEIQMGPIQYGPLLPGQASFGLGNNQRSDVIVTTVQLNVRTPALPLGTDPRDDTKKMLQELADIVDPLQWKRRAVAFKLMKENESDYLGAQLTEQALAALVAALADLTRLRAWMDFSSVQHEVEANRIYDETRTRGNQNILFKIFHAFTNAFSFRF